jgi:hypothetical protein
MIVTFVVMTFVVVTFVIVTFMAMGMVVMIVIMMLMSVMTFFGQVLERVLFKTGFATGGAEIIGLTQVFAGPLGGRLVNFHFANGINSHGNSPLF